MNQNNLPDKIPKRIESARLVLRCPAPGDESIINTALLETFEQLHPWFPWADKRPTLQETENYIKDANAKFLSKDGFDFDCYLKETGAFVARVGLHGIEWSGPKFVLGYWTRASFQRQGFALEAVRSITALAFDILKAIRVEVYIDPKNISSKELAEKAGFVFEGELRNKRRNCDGNLFNNLLYSMVPKDYVCLKQLYPKYYAIEV